MADFPYFPFYPGDFVIDTQHLSTAEVGAYVKLMCAAWMQDDCTLPSDDRMLQRTTGIRGAAWVRSKETLLSFWSQTEEGRLHQKRLTMEREKVIAMVAQKSYAGRSSQAKRKSLKDKEQPSTGVKRTLQRQGNGNSTIQNQSQSKYKKPLFDNYDHNTGTSPAKGRGVLRKKGNDESWDDYLDGVHPLVRKAIGEAKPGESWETYLARYKESI